jgi:hypothetical protein
MAKEWLFQDKNEHSQNLDEHFWTIDGNSDLDDELSRKVL